MNWDGNGPAVRMCPSLMTANLPLKNKAETGRHALEIHSAGARHE